MLTVLYVDDNFDNRFIVRKFMEHMGYKYIEAATAHAGLSMAETQIPDVILMDIHLPDMSGLVAVERLKGNPLLHHIPIIALTADTSVEDICRRVGCDAYLNKPISYGKILRTITQILPLPA